MITFLMGFFVSYLIGSIPTAFIVGKLVKNIDIRSCGSGNVGATNVFRSVGKKWGIIVLLCDMIKGLVVVLCATLFFQTGVIDIKYLQCVYGIGAICGHNWTLFLRFKGGKGVATTSGVIVGIFPKALLLSLVVFAIIVVVTRYVSVGSILSALIFPLFLWLFYRHDNGFSVFLVLSLIMITFIIYRHRSNIQRLIKGEEHKLHFTH